MSLASQHRYYEGRPVLTTAEASKRSGLNRHYIIQLLHAGRIEGVQPLGREWMVYEDSLQAFLAQPRSPGRKGPRKKREMRHTEQGDRVLLSTAEAQNLTGYARDTLLRLLRSGHITGEKSGRTWLIFEDSLLAYKQRKHPTIVESTQVKPQASPESSPSLEPPSELESPEPSPDE